MKIEIKVKRFVVVKITDLAIISVSLPPSSYLTGLNLNMQRLERK